MDDLILFSKATPSQAKIIMKVLEKFQNMSGQSISFSKSKISVSPKISRVVVRQIQGVCNINITDNMGKYLGVPLIHSRIDRNNIAT